MAERGNSFLRAVDYYVGIPLSFATSFLRRLDIRYRAGTEKFAVICQGAIGDMLLVSALCNGLKSLYPDSFIEIIASTANAQALELLPDIDSGKVFPVTQPYLAIRHMRKMRYDILFDSSQWSRLGSILSNLSGAKLTVGFSTPGQFRARGYELKVPHKSNVHELENFLSLGRAVWADFHGKPVLRAPGGKNGPRKNYFCHMWPAPGKGAVFKMWPEDHWVQLIEILLRTGEEVFLTGGFADHKANKIFAQKFFPGEKRLRLFEENLSGLANMLVNAKALVSVNTGVMHLGALLDAPTVGLHGATNPLRWGPTGKNCISLLPSRGQNAYLNLGFEYPSAARPWMEYIAVNDALLALRQLGALPES